MDYTPFAPNARPVDVAILYGLGQKDRAQHLARELHPGAPPGVFTAGEEWDVSGVGEFLSETLDDDAPDLDEFGSHTTYSGSSWSDRILPWRQS